MITRCPICSTPLGSSRPLAASSASSVTPYCSAIRPNESPSSTTWTRCSVGVGVLVGARPLQGRTEALEEVGQRGLLGRVGEGVVGGVDEPDAADPEIDDLDRARREGMAVFGRVSGMERTPASALRLVRDRMPC